MTQMLRPASQATGISAGPRFRRMRDASDRVVIEISFYLWMAKTHHADAGYGPKRTNSGLG